MAPYGVEDTHLVRKHVLVIPFNEPVMIQFQTFSLTSFG